MRDLEAIRSKTKSLLESAGGKNIYFRFIALSSQKPGLEERKKLRRALARQIEKRAGRHKSAQNFNWSALLKITDPPDCPFASVSISHCSYLGAFLLSFDKNFSIGFDMERQNRVEKKIVARVSSKKELALAPSPSLLWTAKEAGLKRFSKNKAKLLLRDCFISNWRKSESAYFFDCHCKGETAFGSAGFAEDLALAFAGARLK